jgi:hypothetical protein
MLENEKGESSRKRTKVVTCHGRAFPHTNLRLVPGGSFVPTLYHYHGQKPSLTLYTITVSTSHKISKFRSVFQETFSGPLCGLSLFERYSFVGRCRLDAPRPSIWEAFAYFTETEQPQLISRGCKRDTQTVVSVGHQGFDWCVTRSLPQYLFIHVRT